MKVGIIGCGAIANIIASSIVPEDNNIDIEYFYDNDVERAENLASFANGVAVLDLEDMLDKVEASRETKSGIIISQKEESEEYAQVVALSGAKEVKVNDHVYEMPLNVGDKVMYKKYSGTDVKDGNEDYILIKAEDILAIVK